VGMGRSRSHEGGIGHGGPRARGGSAFRPRGFRPPPFRPTAVKALSVGLRHRRLDRDYLRLAFPNAEGRQRDPFRDVHADNSPRGSFICGLGGRESPWRRRECGGFLYAAAIRQVRPQDPLSGFAGSSARVRGDHPHGRYAIHERRRISSSPPPLFCQGRQEGPIEESRHAGHRTCRAAESALGALADGQGAARAHRARLPTGCIYCQPTTTTPRGGCREAHPLGPPSRPPSAHRGGLKALMKRAR